MLTRLLFAISLLVSLPINAHAEGFGATPASLFSLKKGFEVELVYDVPGDTQGSWVSLTVDPKGRLIACDQYGGLYRIDVSNKEPKVEKLDIDFAGAQGLLCAFGSLYANVNGISESEKKKAGGGPFGVWRLTDTDGDDQYDEKQHIVPLNGGSEHGPHGLVLSPDGKRILFVAGNNTTLPKKIDRSRVPRNWQEDHLLGRMPDARGHNADRMAPGGFIASINPDGSDFEIVATGFRNPYDIALNRNDELFAYDADMEWDVGTPWYRPTRINHVISGAEFGWRNGTGKWPAYYPDSFGAAVNIGPGSPTGITFGYGAKFPAKYQNALFIADWSYGNIHAVHLTPDGSSYNGTSEVFATAAPLPATDLVIHPDGMLYFTVGGRGTQSGLYRIRYLGEESTTPVAPEADHADVVALRELRHRIEASHLGPSSDSIELAIANLGHVDRAIRFAARIALEQQNPELWRDKVLTLENPQARIIGAVALSRTGKLSDRDAVLHSLGEIPWDKLASSVKIDLLRAYSLVAVRLGGISGDAATAILEKLASKFPTGDNEVDRELAMLLVYLDAEGIIPRVVHEMESSSSQENQIHYAMTLRNVKKGWTEESRQRYFQWFSNIQSARGGMSFGGFIENIKKASLENLDEATKKKLASVIHPPKKSEAETETKTRALVKQWTVEELSEAVTSSNRTPNFKQGRTIFGEAQCYKCHRIGVEGGILGPDLTAAGGRFNQRDLLVSILEPSKEISDQYGATQFLTDDGRAIVGRVINLRGNTLNVMTNMLDPSSLTVVARDTIEEVSPSKNSMMPTGLLDTFTPEEIIDLLAYLRAGGRPNHPIYRTSN